MVIKLLRRGAVLGLALYGADLIGAALAIGQLFDAANPRAWGLLALGAAFSATVGAAVWLVLGLGWHLLPLAARRRWNGLGRPCATTLGLLLLLCTIGGGYGFRAKRSLAELPPRPPITAKLPAPVLWITIDTLRADILYGERGDFPNAPALGKWAEGAIVFNDAEASAGWTVPSVAAYLSGVHNTTVDASAGYLPPWTVMAAEHFRGAGYQTHAVVDNVLIEPRVGFAAGFDTFFQRSGFRFAFSLPGFRLLPRDWHYWLMGWSRATYFGAEGLTKRAIAALEKAATPELGSGTAPPPPFLYVHYMDPHAPYYLHEAGAADPKTASGLSFLEFHNIKESRPPQPTAPEVEWMRHRYDAEIAYLDSHLERLLTAWRKHYGATGVVVITSDHGEEFMEHGRISHGFTVNREMIHVPLLMALPPDALSTAPSNVDEPVTLLNVLPTVLDVVGIDSGAVARARQAAGAVAVYRGEMQGKSMLPWLSGASPAPSVPLVSSHSRHGRRPYRLREGNWALVRTFFYDDRETTMELYDLAEDPNETTNLLDEGLGEHRQQYRDMVGRLDDTARALRNAGGLFDPKTSARLSPAEQLRRLGEDATAAAGDTRREAAVESLRALGYVQ